ncbi:MAG: hypothetical protein ACERKS_12690 [Candidatus Bathyarchaeota archaeon]
MKERVPMGRTTRLLLVMMLLILVGIVPILADPIETTVPYEIPWGLINVIQRSEDIDTPFHSLVEQEYPLYEVNYTAPLDGWLMISIEPVNDTLPEILVNGEEVFSRQTPFWREMVYEGDYFELVVYPPEHLNDTFTVVQDDVFVTVYDVYTWLTLLGNLTFSLDPREAINPSFTWTSENQVGETSLTFKPDWGDFEIVDYNWLLMGEGMEVKRDTTRLITPVLHPGEYLVTLTVVDEFGYSASSSQTVLIEPDPVDALYDPALTEVTVKDIQYPPSAGVNELVDLAFGLGFSCPVPRDMRVDLVDVATGEVLASLEDHLNGEGTEYYSLSIATSTVAAPMSIIVKPSFLNGDEWVEANGSSFVIQLTAPVEAFGSVPGFPIAGVIVGLFGLILLKKRGMARSIPSPCARI